MANTKDAVVKATNGGDRKPKRKPTRDPARAIGGGGKRVMPARGKRRGRR